MSIVISCFSFCRWSYRGTKIDPNENRSLQKSAERLPITVVAAWNPDEASVSTSVPFPAPEFPVINLHWMAPGQLGALRKQGVLSQFLIFNTHLEVIEQVIDIPNAMGNLLTSCPSRDRLVKIHQIFEVIGIPNCSGGS